MKDLQTTSCKFNSKDCTSCANYTMCSLLNTEKHLNKLENQMSNIFNSLNSVIEFSMENGRELKELTEIIPNKDDILKEFSLVYKELDNLKKLFINGNDELKKLMMQYSEEVKSLMTRLSSIETIVLKEQGTKNHVS